MQLVASQSTQHFRRPAWLLTWSLLPFLLWLGAVVATMSGSGVTDSADLDRGQMDGIRVGWMVIWPLYAAAVIFGSVALGRVNQNLRATSAGRLATASQVALAVSVLAILGNLVFSEISVGFTEARLGDNGAYGTSLVLSYVSIWAGAVALLFTGLALRGADVLRRTGLMVAIIAGVVLVLDALTRAFPPFFIGFLWLALGIGLLRRRVPSST